MYDVAKILEVLNKFFGMGMTLREACTRADMALELRHGSAKAVLCGRAS